MAIATLWAGSLNSFKRHFLRVRRKGTNAEASGTGNFFLLLDGKFGLEVQFHRGSLESEAAVLKEKLLCCTNLPFL